VSAAREARRVLVTGRVQGVGFRWHTVERAEALGLVGWVRNLPDGRVEAHLEGDAADVESMLAWLRRGPPVAHVRGLDVRPVAPVGGAGFLVRR
jgi:acylphosphatase